MAQMPTGLMDEEIRNIMKAIAVANGRPLSDERIEADLPAYKNYLAAIGRLNSYSFKQEDEPAFHFSLTPQPSGAKDGSR